jgi:diadenosine tetraphosphate (Ap4A) HIT family hydrolase
MGRHSTATELGGGLDDDWRADRVGAARRGENPYVIARMPSGWAVVGDTQFLPGYCLLLSDVDDANHLTDLSRPQRAEFLLDMTLLGEAIVAACNGLDPFFRRLNYEILGNTDKRLHAHLFPRYGWEPEELIAGPVWAYPRDRWTSPRDAYSEENEPLREAITLELTRILAETGRAL